MDKTKICFARIDTKPQPVIMVDYRVKSHTAEEETLRLNMTLEYLQGVAKLQGGLREKYAPLFEGLKAAEEDDQDVIWAAEDKWHEEHGSEYSKVDHLYYT